jgi:HK97 family phage major capsid protein
MTRSNELAQIAADFGAEHLLLPAILDGLSPSQFRTQALEAAVQAKRGFPIAEALRAVFEDPAQPKFSPAVKGQLAAWAGGPDAFEPKCWRLPLSALAVQRDLNVASPTAGGYLTESTNLDPRDILRPWSVTAQSGLEVIPNVSTGQLLPILTTAPNVSWLADETDPADESVPNFATVAGEPHAAAGLVQISRQLLRQSNADEAVRTALLRTAATAIDAAVINGSGASGQPEGLLNTAGIGTQSGASLDRDGTLAMKSAIATADADDQSITFIAPPAVRQMLEGRDVGTDTGRYVWDRDQVADRPARVTTDCPASTVICGDWTKAVLLLYGTGIEVAFNQFDPVLFRQGVIQARVLVHVDFLVPRPAAFAVATSVT